MKGIMNTDTHYACDEQIKLHGGDTKCCECTDHECKTENKHIKENHEK